MKKPSNWNDVKAAGERVKLPAGGYEAKIINAKVLNYDGSNGSYERLEIAVIQLQIFNIYFSHMLTSC